ncbi:MAG TPA: UDP-N-acetylglucosamine--N-acetylmuramyl-(pentapeptide) pyrophosphoryl-undecaprenol N-acetylglucosamine transferase [Chloroflexota bacterium]|jgi:UDP-N-acetylglucosamine--N-acetylmuramyl-(pentapeptide) pyrophosphoryl-undecaprenol N-acetylglucosamine transferase
MSAESRPVSLGAQPRAHSPQHRTPGTRLDRLAIAGGGTAGHVFPALSVIAAIEGSRLWIGSKGGMEEPLVVRAGIRFVGIDAGAVIGRNPFQLGVSALRNLRGFRAARATLGTYRPEVLLATGGYVSVPAVLAAKSLGVPSALYLPDVEPGLAVRALGRVVDRIACTTGASVRYLPAEKVVPTGYPVRRELRDWAARPDGRAAGRAALGLPAEGAVLLVMGGSRGALRINRAVWSGLDRLAGLATVVHITGRDWISDAESRRAELPAETRQRYRPLPFAHEELGALFAAADLGVFRAGASTLGELPAFGLPGVLIPGRFASGHQRHNAEHMADAGAAVVLDDRALDDAGVLPAEIARLLAAPGGLERMAAAAKALDRPDAAERVADMLAQLARRDAR